MSPPPEPHRSRSGADRTPTVRVVVLNHDGGEHVLRCLEHLAQTEWPTDALQLVMVDNASSDGSADVVAARFPEVEVRRLATNGGFPSVNAGLRDLDGVDHVALVNNDAFVSPGWLAPLVEALETTPTLGAACPKILLAPRCIAIEVTSPTFAPRGHDDRRLGVRVQEVAVDGIDVTDEVLFGDGFDQRGRGIQGPGTWTDGSATLLVPAEAALHRVARLRIAGRPGTTVDVTCGSESRRVELGAESTEVEIALRGTPVDVRNNLGTTLTADGRASEIGYLEIDAPDGADGGEVPFWCGAAVLLRTDYLRDVGLFDERLFLYWEDVDLAWRGRNRGWRHQLVPTSVVRHLHGASSDARASWRVRTVWRNRLVVLTRNAPARRAVRAIGGEVQLLLRSVGASLRSARRRRRVPDLGAHRVPERAGALAGFVRLAPGTLRMRWAERTAGQPRFDPGPGS